MHKYIGKIINSEVFKLYNYNLMSEIKKSINKQNSATGNLLKGL